MIKKNRIEHEKIVVEQMIRIYCRRKEGNRELCDSCKSLLEYTHKRLDLCPFKENKGLCRKCTIHCYNPAMREHIRKVMKYSGPRMLIYSPREAIKHMFS